MSIYSIDLSMNITTVIVDYCRCRCAIYFFVTVVCPNLFSLFALFSFFLTTVFLVSNCLTRVWSAGWLLNHATKREFLKMWGNDSNSKSLFLIHHFIFTNNLSVFSTTTTTAIYVFYIFEHEITPKIWSSSFLQQ